jgi:competence protein ComEA
MQDARIRLALAVFGLIVLGGSGWAWLRARQSAAPPVVITTSAAPDSPAPTPAAQNTTPTPPHKASAARIYVHVAGAVKHPWLYALPAGSRVMQAVLIAGGPTPNADLNAVNLAEPVRDGEKVYVPIKQAALPAMPPPVPPGNALGHASALPSTPAPTKVASTAPMPTVIEPGLPSSSTIVGIGKKHSGVKGDKLTSPDEGQISLNTADAAQLERLPSVGPAMAARILAFREQAHGFQSIGELQEVAGIGPKKFAKIAPFVTLN